MEYYAKVNTAHPAIGLISTGEVLTEKQAEALGQAKIAELVDRGVLAACEVNSRAAAPSPAPKPDEETPDRQEEEETGLAPMDSADDDEADDELPELDMEDDIVTDEPAEAPAEEPKKAGRRKKK